MVSFRKCLQINYVVSCSSTAVTTRHNLACVASVSNQVIARKLEPDQQKKKGGRGKGRGEEEMLAHKPHDSGKCPLIFHSSVHCKLTAHQSRSITHQIFNITLNCSLIEHVSDDCKNCNKKGLR